MNRLAFGEFHQKHFGPQQKAYWHSILFQQQPTINDHNFDVAHNQNTQYDCQDYSKNDQQEHTYYNEQAYTKYNQENWPQYNQEAYSQYYEQEYLKRDLEKNIVKLDDQNDFLDQNAHVNQPNHLYQELDQNYDDAYYEEGEEENFYGLSKEAVEIFKFSEAYRLEKETERQKEEKENQEGMENWQYDESNVSCFGGVEAPVTSLVLLKSELERPKANTKLRIQEELINSAYLSSCRQNSNSSPVLLWPVIPFKM